MSETIEIQKLDLLKLNLSFCDVNDIDMINKIKTYHENAINKLLKNKPEVSKIIQGRNLRLNLNSKMRSTAGRAKGGYLIDINYRLMKDNQQELEETYIHELAHIICCLIYPFERVSHGKKWKNIMKDMGFEPNRTHNMDTSSLKIKRDKIEYSCRCSSHFVTSIIHKRITLQNRYYSCKKCKTKISLKEK